MYEKKRERVEKEHRRVWKGNSERVDQKVYIVEVSKSRS